MGVRDYDAKLSQFLTPDPLHLEDLAKCQSSPLQCSLYGYAAGNPISFVDPNGLEGVDAFAPLAPFAPTGPLVSTGAAAAMAAPLALSGIVAGGLVVGVKLIQAGAAAAAAAAAAVAGEPGPIYCSDPFECMAADLGRHLFEHDQKILQARADAANKELVDATDRLRQAVTALTDASSGTISNRSNGHVIGLDSRTICGATREPARSPIRTPVGNGQVSPRSIGHEHRWIARGS